MELTDRAFVARARSGDADAFRVLVERHGRSLFRLAFRMTGNEQDAEDVVQESFLRAYRQLAKFDERASFGTWLYRIAANCSLDLVRSRKRRGVGAAPAAAAGAEGEPSELDLAIMNLASNEPTPERAALSTEVRDRVAEAMNDLSATERTAFVLRHFEGMCIEEVSRVLECQPGAAKHSVFRAVQKLRRALEPLVSTAR
jgi:RNA polymerase sigma-70 factor (ECF subfamily)